MTPEDEKKQLEEVVRLFRGNFPLYSKNVLRLVDKSGELTRFRLNPAQQRLHDEIERQKAERGYVRVIILKARQMGFSTYVQGRFFWQTTQRHNCSTFVLSHLAESTASIFSMVSTFYDNAPHVAFKPPLKSRTATSLSFDLINSKYRVGTARTGQTGRSMTNTLVHGSEVAFYPDAETVAAGLVQTVPPGKGEIILESTANGASGWFYEQCMAAMRGDSEWKFLFFPWYEQAEYRRPIPDDFERTEEENALARTYKLDDEQLMFRRAKILELGSERKFRQEYPCNPREAFLTSGRTFVEPNLLDDAAGECWTAPYVGEITESGFRTHKEGPLKIWEPPKGTRQYTIGADVAEGLEHGDYTVAQVLDEDGNQVACWHGHVDPYEFAEILKYLGYYYNRAYLIVERNNHGLTTLRHLQELGYPNLYVEEVLDFAYSSDKLVKKIGWLTTAKSRPVIIDNLAKALLEGNHGIADLELVNECRTFVVDEKGRAAAQAGCYDDRVMAFAIARHGLSKMPRRTVRTYQQYTPVDPVVGV